MIRIEVGYNPAHRNGPFEISSPSYLRRCTAASAPQMIRNLEQELREIDGEVTLQVRDAVPYFEYMGRLNSIVSTHNNLVAHSQKQPRPVGKFSEQDVEEFLSHTA